MSPTQTVDFNVSVTSLAEVMAIAHAARNVIDLAPDPAVTANDVGIAEGYALVRIGDLDALDAAVSVLLPGRAAEDGA